MEIQTVLSRGLTTRSCRTACGGGGAAVASAVLGDGTSSEEVDEPLDNFSLLLIPTSRIMFRGLRGRCDRGPSLPVEEKITSSVSLVSST